LKFKVHTLSPCTDYIESKSTSRHKTKRALELTRALPARGIGSLLVIGGQDFGQVDGIGHATDDALDRAEVAFFDDFLGVRFDALERLGRVGDFQGPALEHRFLFTADERDRGFAGFHFHALGQRNGIQVNGGNCFTHSNSLKRLCSS